MTQALIRFKCSCGKRLAAPVKAAGRKGKCSKCGKTVSVPKAKSSQSRVAEVDPEQADNLEHPALEQCYRLAVKRFSKQLDHHGVEHGRPVLRFVLPEDRQQEIRLSVETDESDREWMTVESEIGTVTTLDEMIIALKQNRKLDASRLYLDDFQILHLVARHRLDALSESAVTRAIKEVAHWADEFEEKLFMIDVR